MSKESSTHIWISTTASILTIVGWLTGIQSIWNIRINSSQLNPPDTGLGIAVLLLSIGVVWGAFFILTSRILAKSKVNILLLYTTIGFFIIIGIAIGIVMYDAFFDLKIILNTPESANIPIAILIIFVLPIGITILAYTIIFEWACSYCGKISLRYISTRNKGTSEKQEYRTNFEGKRILRISRFNDYEVDRKCRICGTTWTYYKSDSLGYHDYLS